MNFDLVEDVLKLILIFGFHHFDQVNLRRMKFGGVQATYIIPPDLTSNFSENKSISRLIHLNSEIKLKVLLEVLKLMKCNQTFFGSAMNSQVIVSNIFSVRQIVSKAQAQFASKHFHLEATTEILSDLNDLKMILHFLLDGFK
jgi:hypothetical protein